jgi:gluconolactonase
MRATGDLVKPNGIIGAPDGKTLFVSDIEAKRTYRFDSAPDGSLTNKTLVVDHGSDGMTLDDEGHIYLTGDGVMVFDLAGRLVEHIRIREEEWTANVCFGGLDRRTLFITASTGLYAIRMRVTGANAAK